MEFKDIYKDEITVKMKSFGAENEIKMASEELKKDNPVLTAFVEDNDIQEITVVSTNIGFIMTFSKEYLVAEKPELGEKPNEPNETL